MDTYTMRTSSQMDLGKRVGGVDHYKSWKWTSNLVSGMSVGEISVLCDRSSSSNVAVNKIYIQKM